MDKSSQKPLKLLDQLRESIRIKHYSYRTEQAYVQWVKRFILFHNKQHPGEMGEKEITQFLSHLAVDRNVSASTQNQALCAIVYLYKHVLHKALGEFSSIQWAKRARRIPVVFTKNEVQRVLAELSGVYKLMATLLYGAGLRLTECLQLRVKDIDFEICQILVRGGKGDKDRISILPETVKADLHRQIKRVIEVHRQDLRNGYDSVYLPDGLARKYPQAGREIGWRYLFPAM